MIGRVCIIILKDQTVAYVDAEDYKKVANRNWSFSGTKVSSGLGCLHNVILGRREGLIVDHIDGDVRNNRRSNLRYVTKRENAWNRSLSSKNSTGFKGVSFRKDRGTYLAAIRVTGRLIKIGTFKTPEEAAQAYDRSARKHYGEFACLNFPETFEQAVTRRKLGAAA